MVDLVIDDVRWCATHGHPYLVLRTMTNDHVIAVAITTEDAQALAHMPVMHAAGNRSCGPHA